MALHASIPPLTADPATAALQRLEWAQRRRATAFADAAHARRRLAAAEEQLREARLAARVAGSLRGGEDMVGMGYVAAEIALTDAA